MIVNCVAREDKGSRKSGRLRTAGYIPAVIYGSNFSNHVIALNDKEIREALRKLGENALVKVEIDGKLETAMIKDIQRVPVGNKILHIDLQQVSSTERIQVQVPIILVGRELKANEGVLQQQLDGLDIDCLAVDIPRNITIDVSHLGVGDSFTVSDIKVEGDFTIVNDGEEVIASIVAATMQEEAEDGGEEVDASDVTEVSSSNEGSEE
ncbi:ribosomal 5S rRNA E-loop binding protein Ctc/L25/TL5 [Gottschalkia acidurici 9a]|uniref:Large ribosomal subunit protein bL25 n=1 Tax=Gottschalkia acidurici (strain ATCC 7906 / DSM 604 / BCRC 14475 / CIP 104303 / KCTC 5404 / NCIMB 10678 / 9a) TaxID=1128398 RepID=K0AV89_GOTA9|nr:50S ribosomal protein L25 [Gottschalkia acidurici]AFS77184.1 ribosomal 5S rRNA E-loop binding protein Ctc/L25/TL5 [Gottschalkia acidurici 9a]